MHCPLCLRDRPLIQSHIFPRQLLARARDGAGGKYLVLREKGPGHSFVADIAYDRILCQECDRDLATRYEDPFREAWWDMAKCPPAAGGAETHLPKGTYVTVEGLDYKTVKLFLLSVLWRASLSVLPMFSQTDLGPAHRDRIRRMLLEGNPDEAGRYPILADLLIMNGEVVDALICPPYRDYGLRDGRVLYSFALAGAVWKIFVSSFVDYHFAPLMLDEAGTLRMPRSELASHDTLAELVVRHVEAVASGVIPDIPSRPRKDAT